MEDINLLLSKLQNQVTAGIAKKLDGFKLLNARLKEAKEEFKSDPTEENKQALEEIEDFIDDSKEELIESLESLLEQKTKRENEELEKQAILRRQDQAKQLKEKQARDAAEMKQKEAAEKEKNQADSLKTPEKKKSGIGAFGLIFGGIILIGSFGAVNYFRNNR